MHKKSVNHHKLAIQQEDRIIKSLEKKLGIRNKPNKAKKCFDELGLSDIYDIIESVENTEKPIKSKKLKNKINIASENNFIHDSWEEGNSEDEVSNTSDEKNNCMQLNRSAHKSENVLQEDIYGRLRDDKGNIVAIKTSKPSFVCHPDNSDEQLLRRIRGLMNRLSSSNLRSISDEIEELFKQYSLHQMCLCLCECIQHQIIKDICLSSQKFISEVAMLIASLHNNVGEEVGGNITHYFCNLFDKLFSNDSTADQSKKYENLLTFICYLHAIGIIEVNLIFDISEKLCLFLNSKNIELIHLLFKVCGFLMRKGSPLRMKHLIINVQKKASEFEAKDKRISFMLDTLLAIKNNNMHKMNSLLEDSPIKTIDMNFLRSTLKNCLKGKIWPSSIPGSYEEVLKSNRWWVKSGGLIEDMESNKIIKKKVKKSNTKNDKLCNKLRLVTPLRKSLFKALITSQNYVDCSQRLIQIGGKQFDEVSNICLLLALREKNFNLFYVYLMKQLVCWDRKYKLSLTFALRNKITNLKEISSIEKNNLTILVYHLVKMDVVPITVLKVIEFADLNSLYSEFLREIIIPILDEEEQLLSKIFSKIKPKDSFATALRLFIICFLDENYKDKLIYFKR